MIDHISNLIIYLSDHEKPIRNRRKGIYLISAISKHCNNEKKFHKSHINCNYVARSVNMVRYNNYIGRKEIFAFTTALIRQPCVTCPTPTA